MENEFGPPRTQHDRNLTIRLEGGGPLDSFTFPIKPNEFQMQHSPRMSTTQTLQGIYQDFGGMGVQKLIYQGHTGWRRRKPNAPNDGFEVFKALYEQSYLEYHRRIQSVDDPSQVKCYVIDDLYDTVYQVSLDDFQASKSKSNPLLYYYTLHMTVIDSQKTERNAIDYTLQKAFITNPAEINNTIDSVVEEMEKLNPPIQYPYKVELGDDLEKISNMFRVRPESIIKANALIPPYSLMNGMILIIPLIKR